MNILLPIAITAAMVGAGTSIAEPAAGETFWSSSGTYAVGDRRIRSTTHRVYECVQPITTARSALPESDPAYWLDAGPTQRFAPFDQYTSTAATATTSITYVLQPGYFNALALYGLVGTRIVVSVKDQPGGSEIFRYPSSGTASLLDAPTGWYDYFFGRRKTVEKLVLRDIPIRPQAEVTVTVSAATGQPVGVGMLNVGDYRPLIGEAAWGGTLSEAVAEPTTYSWIKAADDGTTRIVRRHHATNLRVRVAMPRASADAALQLVQDVLDVPVSWITTDKPGFDGLNVFGIGSGALTYTANTAQFDITVKGLI